jgi:hypothetical protein
MQAGFTSGHCKLHTAGRRMQDVAKESHINLSWCLHKPGAESITSLVPHLVQQSQPTPLFGLWLGYKLRSQRIWQAVRSLSGARRDETAGAQQIVSRQDAAAVKQVCASFDHQRFAPCNACAIQLQRPSACLKRQQTGQQQATTVYFISSTGQVAVVMGCSLWCSSARKCPATAWPAPRYRCLVLSPVWQQAGQGESHVSPQVGSSSSISRASVGLSRHGGYVLASLQQPNIQADQTLRTQCAVSPLSIVSSATAASLPHGLFPSW